MRILKRLFIVSLLLFSFSFKVSASNGFALRIVSRETKTVMGVQHQKINVVMRFNGVETNQQINYMGANPTTNKNISVVALDNYTSFDLNRGTILGQIYKSQTRYPNQKIVSAVNGDFFDINSTMGQNAATAGPHIRDGQVMFEGYSASSALSVGIKRDGSPFIGKPSFDGYHIQVVDEEGSVKEKDLKVKINQLPTGPTDLAVFLPSFQDAKSLTGKKMIIGMTEQAIHRRTSGIENGRYFVKGNLLEITEEPLDEIALDTMVLVGDDFFLENLIEETDTIRLQQRPSGDYKDVYHAVSGRTMLVENGEVLPQTNKDVHPRTATGLKADGTLFFVVVDGRQAPDYVGVTYEQLGEILKYFGAETGFNLDGGGSSTMVVLDPTDNQYVTHNSPSDGNLRSDANGIGFIYGPRFEPLPPIPYPDTRPILNSVNSILLEGNKLSFSPVENADRYVVTVDGQQFKTTENEVDLLLEPGVYDISIKAFGNHDMYKQSDVATYGIEIYSSVMESIMDTLLNYGKQTYQYINE